MSLSTIVFSTSYNPNFHHLHVMKENDTLETLAANHKANEGEIRELNPNSKFVPDELLLIPRS